MAKLQTQLAVKTNSISIVKRILQQPKPQLLVSGNTAAMITLSAPLIVFAVWRLLERRSPGTSALIRTTFVALRDTLVGAFRLCKITACGMISLVAAVVSQLRRMSHHRVTANVDGRVSDLQRAGCN